MYIYVKEENNSLPLSYLFKVHRETTNSLVTSSTSSCMGLSKKEREKSIVYWDKENNSRKNDIVSTHSYKIIKTYKCTLDNIPDSIKDKCIIID